MAMGESLNMPGFPTTTGLKKTVGELSCGTWGWGKGGCPGRVCAGLRISRQISFLLECCTYTKIVPFLSFCLCLFTPFLVYDQEQAWCGLYYTSMKT